MSRKNTLLLNFSGGEVSPQAYGREDLPAYQRGWQRVQNYEILPQGSSRFRNGNSHVHNTRGLGTGRLKEFTFNESDTFMLEFTDKKLRFYRDFGTVMNTATVAITGVSLANPCIVTAPAHGFSNGQEIYISGVVGTVELNNQYFLVSNVTTNTFELNNIFNQPIDSTTFVAYVSGGTIETPYEISTPYAAADLSALHFSQSADTVYITSQKYAPYKLTRSALTSWTLNYFSRTADPFNQITITAVTEANPGVFTTGTTAHNLSVGDEVYFDGFAGGSWANLNGNRYYVNTVPSGTTFTVKDETTGTPLDTTTWGTPSAFGIEIATKMCPATSAFLSSSRLMYANWPNNPAGLAASELPDSTTGATQFDNFTTGSQSTNAFLFTVAPVFNQQDAIQWITSNNNVVVLGCASSMRIMTGSGGPPNPITPSSIQVTPINNVGAAAIQPYSNGMTVYYVDQTTFRVQSFVFDIQVYNYVTVNQNLLANHLSTSPFLCVAQQRREASLLWVCREDGVLLGLTFDEIESVYGWHRHYNGGSSQVGGTTFDRAKILSVAVEPRLNSDAVLWLMVERQLANGQTYRSVEYWNQFTKWFDANDYYSGNDNDAQQADQTAWKNAVYEQQKKDIYVDCATTYDGSALSTASLTLSATTGNGITITASSNFFTAAMVGQQIWKAYDENGNGGGRAQITGYTSPTQVTANVLVGFDSTAAIASGSWFLATGTVYGLLNLAGETLAVQVDGAPGGNKVVAADGSITLDSPASVVHAGYPYTGMLASLNIDVGGDRGPAQAKKRKIRHVIPRFSNTVGARVGTDKWSTQQLIFKDQDDVTDRPTPPWNDVFELRVEDSFTRETKQVIILQDIPSPQTVLSVDVEVETADD